MEKTLPFEILKENVNKNVRLLMRKEKVYSGLLKEFDEHGNLYLENIYEIDDDGCSLFVGSAVINGGSIAMIDIE